MHTKAAFWLLGVVILMASALIIFLLITFLSERRRIIANVNQPIVTNTPLGQDTSDWQTYRNEQYGFEVKYPEDYYFYPDSINGEIVARLEDYFVEMSFSKNINRDSPFAYELLLHPQKDYRIHSLDDYIKVRTNTPDLENTYEVSKVSINGQEVARIHNVNKKVFTDLTSYTFYREQDGVTFTFTIIPKDEESLALVETIISTFKFIESPSISEKDSCEQSGGTYIACPLNPPPNAGLCLPCQCPEGSSWSFTKNTCVVDTSTWKTYRNEQYGFEVKYPPTAIAGLTADNSELGVGGIYIGPLVFVVADNVKLREEAQSFFNN